MTPNTTMKTPSVQSLTELGISIKKTQPTKLCYIRNYNYCWGCNKLTKKADFSRVKDVCKPCFEKAFFRRITDLMKEVASLKKGPKKEKK